MQVVCFGDKFKLNGSVYEVIGVYGDRIQFCESRENDDVVAVFSLTHKSLVKRAKFLMSKEILLKKFTKEELAEQVANLIK